MITEVAAGSTAERSGLRAGDVILGIDGVAIQQPSAFDFRLATKPIGTEVSIDYLRDGRETTVSVVLEAPPGVGEAITIDGNTRFAGTTVETMNPATAQELGLPFSTVGVVVRDVARGSPAAQLGLRPGDLILNLNGRDITDAGTFAGVAQARPDAWQIVLQRGGRVFRSIVSG
jgi:serine protease Do